MDDSWWSTFWQIVGILSAGAAFLSTLQAFRYGSRLARAQELVIAQTQKQAGDAIAGAEDARQKAETARGAAEELRVEAAETIERAARAKADAAAANERAAKAEQATETERLERIRLEAAISPRRISPEARTDLLNRLRRFSGRTVRVISLSNDVEAAALAMQVIAALREAGLVVDEKIGGLLPIGGVPVGVLIRGKDRPLATELARGLLGTAGLVGFLPAVGDDSESKSAVEDPSQEQPDALINVWLKPMVDPASIAATKR